MLRTVGLTLNRVLPSASVSLTKRRLATVADPPTSSSSMTSPGAQHDNNVGDASEPLWKDPYKHALPAQATTYTDYKEADVDWSNVERLLPKRVVPEMPRDCGVLPSGWRPPQEPAPEVPYYIRRSPKHVPKIFLESRRNELNVKTMDFEYEEVVSLRGVGGDIFACERDLKAFLEKKVGHPVATHVDELKGVVKTKGAHRKFVEAFVFETGF